MVFLLYLTTVTTAIITQVMASCPAVCDCPAETLICPPGVSLLPDGCGCCKVCAAQLNQDCSTVKPCDHHKGLECNYGNDVTVAWGICRAKSDGRTCEYNGRIYQNGETFRAGCKHQCSCIDGAVGCAPLCNNQLPPASRSCPHPHLTRIPGQCCLSVDCHRGTWRLPPKQQAPPTRELPRPGIQQAENGLDGDLTEVKSSGWESKRGYKHLPMWNHVKDRKCLIQTTEWTQCSRSCGMGISSRITNKNPQCKLERQTRVCTIRPCIGTTPPSKRGKKCSQIHRAPAPVHLPYGECQSVRWYRPNHCGTCTDGRCCLPRRTRTASVSFVCPNSERFQRSVMFTLTCKCSRDCSHLNEVALSPQFWMYGDTHTFTD